MKFQIIYKNIKFVVMKVIKKSQKESLPSYRHFYQIDPLFTNSLKI